MSAINPYSAPDAAIEEKLEPPLELVLASRSQRLGAFFVDLFFVLLVLLVGGLFVGILSPDGTNPHVQMLLGWAIILVISGVNLFFLFKNSQSFGKKMLGIRIVRRNGDRASFARIFFFRMLIGRVIPGVMPMIGIFYSVLDSLFIFRIDQCCLHDIVADTKVEQLQVDE